MQESLFVTVFLQFTITECTYYLVVPTKLLLFIVIFCGRILHVFLNILRGFISMRQIPLHVISVMSLNTRSELISCAVVMFCMLVET